MTLRSSSWLLVLPALLAIGCAAEPTSNDEGTEPATAAAVGTEDLKEASPETESTASTAKGRDAVVDQARADQLVGEEATGYLGLVTDDELIAGKAAPSDLVERVKTINEQRRALYTDLSAKHGVALVDVEHSTACILLRDKVKVGEAYRAESTEWKVRVFDMPVATPSFCAAVPSHAQ